MSAEDTLLKTVADYGVIGFLIYILYRKLDRIEHSIHEHLTGKKERQT